LSTTLEASIALGEGFGIKFYGLHQCKLTLSIDSIQDVAPAQSMFGGAPFGSVRKLHIHFAGPPINLTLFVVMLRAMRGLEWLEMERNIGEPLAFWAELDDQAEIAPALHTLIITDTETEEVGRRVRELELARERAGVRIAHVEVGVLVGS
jgi:hypothetical protein